MIDCLTDSYYSKLSRSLVIMTNDIFLNFSKTEGNTIYNVDFLLIHREMEN